MTYSRHQLLVLFGWLLWGDFALSFFESIFTRYIPIYFQELHASNTLIGFMTGSIPGIVNILFLPNISQWSDRYRSRMGRRIPFLYVAAPSTAFFLIAVGFAPEISAFLFPSLRSLSALSITLDSFTLSTLCCLVSCYHFFNMILLGAYNWLLRDVVPIDWIARFLAWFRIISTVASMAFLWLVFPHADTHRKPIFFFIGLFYLTAFLLMCSNVKEREYPDAEIILPKASPLGLFLAYFKHCLSIPIYRNLFLVYTLGSAGISCASPFVVLFAKDNLALSMNDIGVALACGAALSAFAFYPVALLCDKTSPIHVTIIALVVMTAICMGTFLCVSTKWGFFTYSILITASYVLWNLGIYTSAMQLFPEPQFGKFFSGLSIFSCGAMIVCNLILGSFIDSWHNYYRVTFMWSAVCFLLAIVPMLLVYKHWKCLGGPQAYAAPSPSD